MATALLSIPTPQQTPTAPRPYTSSKSWLHAPLTSVKYPYKAFILLSSSSSSSSVSVVEDGASPPSPDDSAPVQSEAATSEADNLPFRGCQGCGREEMERGCNGEGRIQGGIATVPGFGWWPIKAYRPCPGFLASGGRYRRQGQSMDEVAFGRGGRTPVSTTPVSTSPVSTNSEVESSKKQGGRKFKR